MIKHHACCFLPPSGCRARVVIEVTQACRLVCRHCQVEAGPAADRELAGDEIRQLLTALKAQGFGRVSFTGGEPLLRPDIAELAAEARGLGYTVDLVTSLSEPGIEHVIDVVHEVTTSIDGATADVHDWLRGAGAFDRTVVSCRQVSGRATPVLKVMTVVHPRVLGSIERLLVMLSDLGAGRLMLINPKSEGRAAVNSGLLLSGSQARAAVDEIMTAVDRVLPGFPVGLSRFPRPGGLPLESCIAGDRMLYVTATGEVHPCQHWRLPFPPRVGDAGLAADPGLTSVVRVRDSHRACSSVPDCGGGCRPFAVAPGGEVPACDQLCPTKG